MSDGFAPRSMKRRNVKGLALSAPPPKPPPTAENANNDKDGDNPNQLEIGIEYNLDLRPQDIEVIKDLGAGNGGTVSKVRHKATNIVMARKASSLLLLLLSVVYVDLHMVMHGRSFTSRPRRRCGSA